MDLFVAALGVAIVFAAYTAIGSVGFSIQFATTNVLNLAYGDIMAIAGYVTYTVHQQGVSLWVAMAGGIIAACLASLVLSRVLLLPAMRRGMGLAAVILLTLGVSIGLEATINIVWGTGVVSFNIAANTAIRAGAFRWSVQDCAVVGFAVVLIIGIQFLMVKTRLGKAMRAVSSNKSLALAYGIPADRITTIGWGLSGLLCGFAGVSLMAESVVFSATTGFTFTVIIVAAAFVGGIGSVLGAVAGATIVGLVTQLAAAYSSPAYVNVFAFSILVLVLVLRPRGIFADPSVQRDIAR